MSDTRNTKRRLALKTLGGSALAGGLADKLPAAWQRPLVHTATLPAHAQVSPGQVGQIRLVISSASGDPVMRAFDYRLTRESNNRITHLTFQSGAARLVETPPAAGLLNAAVPAAHAQNAELSLMEDLELDFSASSLTQTGTLRLRYGPFDCGLGISVTLLPDRTAVHQIQSSGRDNCGTVAIRPDTGEDSGFGILNTPPPTTVGPTQAPATAGPTQALTTAGPTPTPGPTTTAEPLRTFQWRLDIGDYICAGTFVTDQHYADNTEINQSNVESHTFAAYHTSTGEVFAYDLVAGELTIGGTTTTPSGVQNIFRYMVGASDFETNPGPSLGTAQASPPINSLTDTGGRSYVLYGPAGLLAAVETSATITESIDPFVFVPPATTTGSLSAGLTTTPWLTTTTASAVARTFNYTWTAGTGSSQYFVAGSFTVPASHTSDTIREGDVTAHTLTVYQGSSASGTKQFDIELVTGAYNTASRGTNHDFEFNAATKTLNLNPSSDQVTAANFPVDFSVRQSDGSFAGPGLFYAKGDTTWRLNDNSAVELASGSTAPTFS